MNDIKIKDMVSTHIRKLKTLQRHHIKHTQRFKTSNKKILIMLLKANELQANIDEVELWRNGIKPYKS